MYVGRGDGGPQWAGAQRSMLVLGPPRSGKTSSLVIPNVLIAEGPVVSTSTKPDVMTATATQRNKIGWNFLFDPSGEVNCPAGVEPMGWSPLTTAGHWDAAVHTAEAMVRAGRLMGGAGSADHWTERAGALLAPILHAAAHEEVPMRTVLRWIDRHDGATPLSILHSTVGDTQATDLLAGIVSTDAREQSGIWSTASGVLAAYRTSSAMASTAAPPLDFAAFCDGANTLYICSPGRHQHQFAPLVVAALADVRDATYVAHAGGATAPPAAATLLALDEVANIAPIPDLMGMVSEGAGQGLLTMACLQDLSQARVRWGEAASGFLSLFGTTVVLPGIADARTLRDLSALGGDHDVPITSLSHTVGTYGRLRPSSTQGTVRLPRFPVDELAHGSPGQARLLGPDNSMVSVTLTPAHGLTFWRTLGLPAPPTLDRVQTEPLARGR
jgi:type IV secretory pathway TraG/TraD family ATPase VirD4